MSRLRSAADVSWPRMTRASASWPAASQTAAAAARASRECHSAVRLSWLFSSFSPDEGGRKAHESG